jgi:hypothetical protein
MPCSNTNTDNMEDTLVKINRQIAQAEEYIAMLLNDIDVGEIHVKGRLDCAIKIMSIYPRLLIIREHCTKSGTDGMSEAERAQQAALADIMSLLEEQCSEERDWQKIGMSGVIVEGEQPCDL